MSPNPNARIAVDIGGTFTDIAFDHGSSLFTTKSLTTRDDPVRGVIDVIRIASANVNCAADEIGAVIHGSVDKQANRQERKP